MILAVSPIDAMIPGWAIAALVMIGLCVVVFVRFFYEFVMKA